ncbi:lipopolysaccharide transport periplasmic protein LptA [Roseovarius atlanticus]|uniref:lipopolysaccharide transport periplasmic protein LptA n=1 Tax=Roseovarius atlanticus TaxID=1641875 RepID=UPI001C987CA2|nr:lipopolysaccharide transport periplasmic protein LptA [Roseovarius atlanticus]MBY5987109.1 lipopolysaccharide transport periplasmic protein LptA [Roseovarius atlanticus]MBY6125749.1 lipopolysaccharide transport periplasmic protein LptA [Roseovarius atlanticus]MBY6149790.1 lipopolysaccharide transport periplasmic protein LptA [Roseovarius atlanticus]
MFCQPLGAAAQGAQVAFGNTAQDSSLPVEVTADNLDVNQQDGTAVFTGNVLIGQGEMRLSAPRVLVVYKNDQSGIEELQATGGVTLVSGEDAAEASRADYNVDTGLIEMEGDVLLVQGINALSGDKMFVDTRAGTARVTGRVKTILQPEDGNE